VLDAVCWLFSGTICGLARSQPAVSPASTSITWSNDILTAAQSSSGEG
jgi:hypothetical protein